VAGCEMPLAVMAGLVPAIPRRFRSNRPHAVPSRFALDVSTRRRGVDGRDKPGHDAEAASCDRPPQSSARPAKGAPTGSFHGELKGRL